MRAAERGVGNWPMCLCTTRRSVAHPFLTNYLHSGKVPAPTGNQHANIVPYNVYQTSTTPLFVAVANDRLFSKLCRQLGVPELALDARFASNRARVENRAALEVLLSHAFMQVDGAQIGPVLLAEGVPAAPIFDIKAVAESEHAKAAKWWFGATTTSARESPSSSATHPPAFAGYLRHWAI